MAKNLPAVRRTQVQSLGQEDPLVKGIATHSSILAWRIPWTERSLVGHSQWDLEESDTTEWLTLSLSFRELGSHMLHRQETKTENRNNIAINSIQTKNGPHKKSSKNNKNKKQCLFPMYTTCSPWEACCLLFEFPELPASSAPSPGISFIGFNKLSAWPRSAVASFSHWMSC